MSKLPEPAHRCSKHPDQVLVCLRCHASTGGKTTAKRYSSKQLKEWGKKGGRPRKTPPKEGTDVSSTSTEATNS